MSQEQFARLQKALKLLREGYNLIWDLSNEIISEPYITPLKNTERLVWDAITANLNKAEHDFIRADNEE